MSAGSPFRWNKAPENPFYRQLPVLFLLRFLALRVWSVLLSGTGLLTIDFDLIDTKNSFGLYYYPFLREADRFPSLSHPRKRKFWRNAPLPPCQHPKTKQSEEKHQISLPYCREYLDWVFFLFRIRRTCNLQFFLCKVRSCLSPEKEYPVSAPPEGHHYYPLPMGIRPPKSPKRHSSFSWKAQ